MKCPNCEETLVMTERQGVEIDYCPKCRGVWLDKGELDKIIERTAGYDGPPQGGATQAPLKQQQPPPQQGYHNEGYGYGGGHHGGHHDDHHGGHHGGHHGRKGFFGRMFDF